MTARPPELVFGSRACARALQLLRFTCLDVGARQGFTRDLMPIAGAVDAVAFEPDGEEAAQLNANAARGDFPWASLRYLPVAIGPANGPDRLHLYRQRGCSSLLEADQALAARFVRGDYFELDGTVSVTASPFDEAAVRFGFEDASYLKIDVQGYELAIFETGRRMLADNLLAIRCEVSFIPLYKGQPLFGDIAAHLAQFGFVPLGFEEMHDWRRTTKVKHPGRAAGPLPYSRGQLVHGDVLFVRDPDRLPDSTPSEGERLLKAAFLALVYGYVDHAAAICARPGVVRYLREHGVSDIADGLSEASAWHARRYRQESRRRAWRRLVGTVKPFGMA